MFATASMPRWKNAHGKLLNCSTERLTSPQTVPRCLPAKNCARSFQPGRDDGELALGVHRAEELHDGFAPRLGRFFRCGAGGRDPRLLEIGVRNPRDRFWREHVIDTGKAVELRELPVFQSASVMP
jgi:hypothetical protein